MFIGTGHEILQPAGPYLLSRGPGFDGELLFGPDTVAGETFSRRVPVVPGTALSLACFNFPEGGAVYTWHMFTGLDTESAPADMYRARMSLGGAGLWVFTPESPQKVVTLPGMYRFEMSDAGMTDGGFAMECRTWRLSECPVGALVAV
jgi:hypothetical protein